MLKYLLLAGVLLYILFLSLLSYSYVLPQAFWWISNALSLAPLWLLAFPFLLSLALVSYLPWKRVLVACNLVLLMLLIHVSGLAIHPNFDSGKFNSLLELNILTSNMGNNASTSKLLKLINDNNIDIAALQETSTARIKTLKKLSSINFECGGNLCLISQYPVRLIDAKSRHFLRDWGVFIAQFEVILATRVVDVFVLHLQTPREGLEELMHTPIKGIPFMKKVTEHQNIESWVAANWVSKGKNSIVLGDFNMNQINPIYHSNWSWLGNSFQQAGNGLGYTKYTRLHGVRIDHILFEKPSWQVTRAWVAESLGGDHRPMIAVLKPC